MSKPQKHYIHAFGVTSTGSVLPERKDIVFAIGAAVLAIDGTGTVERVESRRWVFRFAPGDQSPAAWETLWREREYDTISWELIWSQHTDVLNMLLASPSDTFASQKDMVASFAAYVVESANKYQPRHLIRFTIGGSMFALNCLLKQHGHPPLFVDGPLKYSQFERALERSEDISRVPQDALDLKDPMSAALHVAYRSIPWKR